MQLPCIYKEYAGKGVYESRFTVMPDDSLTIVSDGVIYAGVGATLNFGWTWDSLCEWLVRSVKKGMSAVRLATMLSQAVSDLYMGECGDDSTVMTVMVKPRQQVNLLASPPKDKALDMQMVRDMMKSSGKKVVCGGSSANMVARCLNRQVYTTLTYSDPSIPPTGIIDGIDLVTEGVLTMSRTVEILRDIIDEKADADDIKRMDEDNGAAQLAKMLLENCTHLKLFIGTAINPALARIQVEGGVMQGIGMTLMEDVRYDGRGRVTTDSLMQYKIPTRLDATRVRVEFEESYEPSGPFGAKSIGEIVINTPAPAICNALYRASGVRVRALPVRAEDVLRGMGKL